MEKRRFRVGSEEREGLMKAGRMLDNGRGFTAGGKTLGGDGEDRQWIEIWIGEEGKAYSGREMAKRV